MNIVDAIISGKLLEAEEAIKEKLSLISKGMVEEKTKDIGATLFGQVSESTHKFLTGLSNDEMSEVSHHFKNGGDLAGMYVNPHNKALASAHEKIYNNAIKHNIHKEMGVDKDDFEDIHTHISELLHKHFTAKE